VNPEYFNVSWAINQMKKSIVDPIGTYYGPAPEIMPLNPEFSQSFNLRLLIHYFGDIH